MSDFDFNSWMSEDSKKEKNKSESFDFNSWMGESPEKKDEKTPEQTYENDISAKKARRDELVNNMFGRTRVDTNSAEYAEYQKLNSELAWDKSEKVDDTNRSVTYKNGSSLKDGETYYNGDGEYYRFDYDAFKRGEDPRVAVSHGEYAKTHAPKDKAPQMESPDDVKTDKLKKNLDESNKKEDESSKSLEALSYLEKKHGKKKGRVTFGAEEIAADDISDIKDEDIANKYNSVSNKGGTLDHRSRPMHFTRDENGKITGYETTKSTVVPEIDGTWSVIPTIRGEQGYTVEMTPEEARVYYRDTELRDKKHKEGEKVGDRWGNFATEEEAVKAANDIHDVHQALYKRKWNQYINEHWGEMADSIKNDSGVRAYHAAWLMAGSPRASEDLDVLRANRKMQKNAVDVDKPSRTVMEDIKASIESETGKETSKGDAALQYLLPGYSQNEKMKANDDISRYERYIDGTYTKDDVKLDGDVADLLLTDKKFANLYGQQMIAQNVEIKNNAAKFLDSTYLPWYGKIGAGTIKNLGYTLEFAIGEAIGGGIGGIALPAFTSSMSRYSDLTANTYDEDENGNLIMSVAGDSEGTAMTKAVIGGIAEAAIEKYLFDNPATKALARTSIARNIRGNIMRALADSKAGNVVLKLANGFNKVGKYTAVHNMPEEILEEDAQAIVDDVFGFGRREGEKYTGSETLTAQGQLDVCLGMLGTMAAQALIGVGMGHLGRDAKKAKEFHEKAQTIYDIPGLSKPLVDNMSDREKAKFLNFYNKYSGNVDKLNDMADRLFGVNGKLEVAFRQAAERDGVRMVQRISERGVEPAKFNIPVDSDGKVAFTKKRVIDPIRGTTRIYNAAVDNDNGVSILELDNGKFGVLDHVNTIIDTKDDLQGAISAANDVALIHQYNQLNNEQKATYGNILAANNGIQVKSIESKAQFLKMFGAEALKSIYNAKVPAMTVDGVTYLILDNINSPAEMDKVVAKVKSGMEKGENGGLSPVDNVAITIENVPSETAQNTDITGPGVEGSTEATQNAPESSVMVEPSKDTTTVADVPSGISGDIVKESSATETEKVSQEKVFDDNVIPNGMNVDVGSIKGLVAAKIADVDPNIEIVGMAVHGSRMRGDNRKDSDLDVVVEIRGDWSEDSLFDALNGNRMVVNGVDIDINPIRADKTGTLADYMERSNEYDRNKNAQSIYETFKSNPIKNEKGELVSPFSGENTKQSYINARLAEMGVDGEHATDDQIKQIEREIAEIEKPYNDAVKEKKKDKLIHNNPLIKGSLAAFRKTDEAPVAIDYLGIYSIPVDFERTRRGGKVIFSNDPAADHIESLLDGYGELRLSKSGKVYLKGSRFVPSHLVPLFGNSFSIGGNDEKLEMFFKDVLNKDSGDVIGADFSSVDSEIMKAYSSYRSWRDKQMIGTKLDGMTSKNALQRIDEIDKLLSDGNNKNQAKLKSERRSLEAWVANRISEIETILDVDYGGATEEEANDDNYLQSLLQELRILKGEVSHNTPDVDFGYGEEYSLAEIDKMAQDDGDARRIYDEALVEVNRYDADSNEVQAFSTSELEKLKAGDIIRFDHAGDEMDFVSFKDGVLTVAPYGTVSVGVDADANDLVQYLVTDKGFQKKGVENGRINNENADNVQPGDAKGEGSATGEERGDGRKKPEVVNVRESVSAGGADSDYAQEADGEVREITVNGKPIGVSKVNYIALRSEDDGVSIPVNKLICENRTDAARLMQMFYTNKCERSKLVFLDKDGKVLLVKITALGRAGSIDIVELKDFIAGNMPNGCTKVILGHNHPSGNAVPSGVDYNVVDAFRSHMDKCGFKNIELEAVVTDTTKYSYFKPGDKVGSEKTVNVDLVDAGGLNLESDNNPEVDLYLGKIVSELLLSPTSKNHSWAVCVNPTEHILDVIQIPENGDFSVIHNQVPSARSFYIGIGKNGFDGENFVKTMTEILGTAPYTLKDGSGRKMGSDGIIRGVYGSNAKSVDIEGYDYDNADTVYENHEAVINYIKGVKVSPKDEEPRYVRENRKFFDGLADNDNLKLIRSGNTIWLFGDYNVTNPIKNSLFANGFKYDGYYKGFQLSNISAIPEDSKIWNKIDTSENAVQNFVKERDEKRKQKSDAVREQKKEEKAKETEAIKKAEIASHVKSDEELKKEFDDIDFDNLFNEEQQPIQPETRSRIEKLYADWVEEDVPEWVSGLSEKEAYAYVGLLERASVSDGNIKDMDALEKFEKKREDAIAKIKADEKRMAENKASEEEKAKRENQRKEIADRMARLTNPKFKDNVKMSMLAINIGNAIRKGNVPKKAISMGKAMVNGEDGTLVQQWTDKSILGVVDNASKRTLDNWVEMAVKNKDYELPHEGDVDKWVNPVRNTIGDKVADDIKTMFMRAINDVRSRRGESTHPDFFWGVGGQGEFWHMYGEEKQVTKRGRVLDNGVSQLTLFEEQTPMDKAMAFGINLAYTFFDNSEDKSFDAFVKFADEKTGGKNSARKLYGSWYSNAAISLTNDIADKIDRNVDAKARKLVGLPERGKDKPGARVANVVQEHLIPSAPVRVNAESYNKGLDADQQLGVNLALESVSKPNGHFMLADGTGFGKTRQILAIADQYKKANPNANVLVCTLSETILNDSFAKDSKAMGIDTSRFTMGTYNGITSGKFDGKIWDIAIFDEAHNLSNPASMRTQAYWRLKIQHKVFATATPMDRPTDATYFMAELGNISQEALANNLGYRIEVVDREGSEPYQIAVPLSGQDFDSVRRNVIIARDKAIASGKMIRRAYPFLGDIDMDSIIPMSDEQHANEEEVVRYFDDEVEGVKYKKKIWIPNRNGRGGKVYEKKNYEDNKDAWNRIVENAKQAIRNQKYQSIDKLNESVKADNVAKVASRILKENPKSRVIIVGSQVGIQTIDGGFAGDKQMKLNGIKSIIDRNKVKYKFEPSLKVADRRLTAMGFGDDIAHIYSGYDNTDEQNDFLSGKKRVLIMTVKSGGTGVNLDDTTGDHPTYMLCLDKDYSAKVLDQLLGRVSRKNTKSEAKVLFVTNSSVSDAHKSQVANQKIGILKAIQGGADMDIVSGMSNDARDDGELREEQEEFAPNGRQKVAGVVYPDASEEIGMLFEEQKPMGKKAREDAKALILKKRQDLFTRDKINGTSFEYANGVNKQTVDDVLDEIGKFSTSKEQKAALHWFIKGAIRLPEDAPKVTEAVQYGERAKGKANTDPMSYDSPMAMIDALHEFKPKAKPINPDNVPQLSDRREMGNGVVTYLVQDDRKGQQAMREIINTHWGEDANPWCLLHGDGHGNLSDGTGGGYDAWNYWEHYSALPKRVAFKDGKLLAFMATDGEGRNEIHSRDWEEFFDPFYDEWNESDWEGTARSWMEEYHPQELAEFDSNEQSRIPEQWWDRQDASHEGIPLGNMPVPNDQFGRWSDFEIINGDMEQVGGYQKKVNGRKVAEWYDNGKLNSIEVDGVSYEWSQPGSLGSITFIHSMPGGSNRVQLQYFPSDDTIFTRSYKKVDENVSEITKDVYAKARELSKNSVNIYRENSQKPTNDVLREEQTSITLDEDSAYMDAVKRGDMETAQRMVRDAAAKAMPNTKAVDNDGLPLVVYHGSEDFDPINGHDHVFDNQKYDGPRQIGADKGYFFTDNYKVASRFGKIGNNSYIPNWKDLLKGTSFNNEKEYDEFGKKLSMTNTPQTDKLFFDRRDDYFDIQAKIRKEKDLVDSSNRPIVTSVFLNIKNPNEIHGDMIGTGLERDAFLDSSRKIGDGAIIRNADTGSGIADEYIVFNDNQIKSADPVTYDENGNVIPLSERFNEENPSILYEEQEEGGVRFFHNESIDEWRNDHKLAELADYKPVKLEELAKRVDKMLSNQHEAEAKVAAIELLPSGEPVSAENQILMGIMLYKVADEYNRLFSEREKAYADGNEELASSKNAQMNILLPKLNRIQQANKKIGNAAGRALQARQFGLRSDYTLAGVMTRAMNANGGRQLSPQVREELEKLVKELDSAGILENEEAMYRFNFMVDQTIKDIVNGLKNEVDSRKLTAKGARQIENEYNNALIALKFQGQTKGALIGMPSAKKHLDALQRYHLLNGEGYTDGKVDEKKMVDLIIADCNGQGVDATDWMVRQALSQMGHSITPPKSQLEKDRRELNTQHLIHQQIAYAMKFNELPPTTGFNRDADTLAVRALRKMRSEAFKALGLDSGNADARLKSALDSMKNRLRNRIEDMENAIKTGVKIEKGEKRKYDDAELLELQVKLQKTKELYDAAFPKTEDELKEESIIRSLRALQIQRDYWEEMLKAAKERGNFDKEEKSKVDDPRLDAVREEIDSIKKEWQALKDAAFPNGTDKEIAKRNKILLNTYEKEIAELDRRIKAASIAASPAEKIAILRGKDKEAKKSELTPEIAKARAEKANKRNEIDELINRIQHERMPFYKVFDVADTLLNVLSRSVRTMWDFSQVLSQGLFHTVNNPKAAKSALADTFNAFMSQDKSDYISQLLEENPYFQDFKAMGGRVYGDFASGGVADEFRGASRKIGKFSVDMIPGVKASERSFGTYLNAMNVAAYKALIEGGAWGVEGPTEAERKVLADSVSVLSGSTKGDNWKNGRIASLLMFAPKYALSTLKIATLQPIWGTMAKRGKGFEKDVFTFEQRRKVALANAKMILPPLVGVAVFQAIVNALFNPDDDEEKWQDFLDPRSTDFLSARLGNGRFNLLKPVTMWWNAIARILTSSTSHYGLSKKQDPMNTIAQLARGKSSPITGLLIDMIGGKDFVGNEIDWSKFSFQKKGEKRVGAIPHIIESMLMPMTIADAKDIFENNGLLTASVLAPVSYFGGRVASYDDEYNRTVKAGKGKLSKFKELANGNPSNGVLPDVESAKDYFEKNKSSVSAANYIAENTNYNTDISKLERSIKQYRNLGMNEHADKLQEILNKIMDSSVETYRGLKKKGK